MNDLADLPGTASKIEFALCLDLAHAILGAVLDRRQELGEGPRAGAVATDRGFHSQRLMRALDVIDAAPGVEVALCGNLIGEDLMGEQFGVEGAVKAFVLPLSLRMIGAGVTDPDPQADEPNGQWCIGVDPIVAPGRAVVHGHAPGQTIAAEGLTQGLLHGGGLFVGAGGETERIAGVVIEYGQGVTTATLERHMALEIHLPEVIGDRMLEALPGAVLGALGGVHPPVAAQDRRDRARARHPVMAQGHEPRVQLASAPSRMLIAQGQHRMLHGSWRSSRRRLGPARPIAQPLTALDSIALPPLVPGLRTDPKTPAQRANIRSLLTGQLNEFVT